MTYTPQPGTIPARVIAWLQAQPAGFEAATGVICDTLDIEISLFGGSMQPALRHGLLTCEKREGRLYWGMATEPAQPAELQEPDDAPMVQLVVPVDGGAPAPAPAAPAKPRALKIPRLAKEPLPKLARQPEDREMRCALWSDGTLVIQQAGQRIELNPEGTRALVRYLERMAGTGE